MRFRNLFFGAVLAAGVFGAASGAKADSVTFTGDNGSGGTLAASAVFDLSGGALTITLTNTATVAATKDSDVLTAIFWTTNPATPINGTFTGVSVPVTSSLIPSGSTTAEEGLYGYKSDIDTVNSVGSHFNGQSVLSATDFGGDLGAYTTILAIGSSTPITTGNPEDTVGGLIPTANGASFGGTAPVIENSIVYTITVPGGSLFNSVSDITGVQFQYGAGTDLDVVNPPSPGQTEIFPGNAGADVVPVPASASSGLILLAGMAGYAVVRRRKLPKFA